MTLDQVEDEITKLKLLLCGISIQSINRFYFDNQVILNVTLKDGFLASAKLVKGELVISKSNIKRNLVDISTK